MADLETTYLGLKLKSPVIIAASPLTQNVVSLMKCEEAGAGAAVMKLSIRRVFPVLETRPVPEAGKAPQTSQGRTSTESPSDNPKSPFHSHRSARW